MQMELRQLKYFVTLSETRNFSRAADREHITQSALSQQVSRLERALGVTLFERTTHGTNLTAAGASLLTQAEAILSEVDRFVLQARALSRGFVGALYIGSPINAAMSARRQALLAEFGERCPDVEVRIESAWSNQLIQRLRERALDLAFITLGAAGPDMGQVGAGQG
jgi:DNA-binding transcriptional LysR family regulator